MADKLPAKPEDVKPEPKSRALSTIVDRKVSLQSVGNALAVVTTRPVLKLAKALGIYVGRLDGAPDKKAVLASMPKGSKVVLKKTGDVLIGMPEADKKSTTDLLREALRQKADLTGMSVTREKLRKLNFSRGTVSGSDFRQSTLAGVDFVRADARDTDFREAILMGTCFEGADLRGADFTRVRFTKESVARGDTAAYASRTDFAYADLTGARFSIDADLTHCRFDKARVEGVVLVDASGNAVEGARLTTDGQIVYDTIVATAEGTKPTEEPASSDLPDGVYKGLVNRDGSLRNTGGQLFSFRYKSASRGTGFGGSDLNYEGAVFQNTRFDGAKFIRSNMRGVDFTDSTINAINFEGADLTGADFSKVTFGNGVTFNVIDADLTDVTLPISADLNALKLHRAKNIDKVRIADRQGKLIEGAKLVEESGELVVDTSAVADLSAYDMPRPLPGVPDMKAALKGLPKGTTVLLNRGGERLLAVPARDGNAVSRADALREAIKRKISLNGLSFTESEFEKTHLSRLSAAGGDFRRTNIRLSDFVLTNLQGADFGGATVHECSFEKANLRKANFAGVDFSKGNKDYGTDFSGADLEGAVFSHDANFKSLRFHHANLQGVVIVDDNGEPIPGAVLTKDAEVVYLGEGATPDPELLGSYDPDFVMPQGRSRWRNNMSDGRDINYKGRTFKGGSFADNRDFSGNDFTGATFTDQQANKGGKFDKAQFNGSTFEGMYFGACSLEGADFSGISLKKAGRYNPLRFSECKLDGARFPVSTDFSLVTFDSCDPKGIALVDDAGELVEKARLVQVNGEWAVDLSRVEDRPDLKTARQLKGLPDPAQIAANLPEGSKCILRTDGSLLAALPNAERKKYRDVLDEAMSRKLDLARMSYRDKTLEQCNLNTQNLEGADFTDGKVHKVDFVRAKLQGAKFTNADIVSPVFDQADLRNVDFTGAKFRKADYRPLPRFVEADLRGAKFSFDVDLSRAQLYGAKLEGVQIIDENGDVIPGASLSHEGKVLFADAPEAQDAEGVERPRPARNTGKDWRWSDFSGQRVHDWGFPENAVLYQSIFDRAELSSFNFKQNAVKDCSFDGVKLSNVSFNGSKLKGSRFTNIDWSNCSRVDFRNADFEGAVFSVDADLSEGMYLDKAKLEGAIFVDADGNVVPDRVFREDGTVRDVSPEGLAAEKAEEERIAAERAAEERAAAEAEENKKDALIRELTEQRDTARKEAQVERQAKDSALKTASENERDARLGRAIRGKEPPLRHTLGRPGKRFRDF